MLHCFKEALPIPTLNGLYRRSDDKSEEDVDHPLQDVVFYTEQTREWNTPRASPWYLNLTAFAKASAGYPPQGVPIK
jgi:hypothetical protein